MKALLALLLLFPLLLSEVAADDILHLYNWNNYISEETVHRFEARQKTVTTRPGNGQGQEMWAPLVSTYTA